MTSTGEAVTVTSQDGIDLVRMTGDIDMANAVTVQEEVIGQVTSGTGVVIELSGVSFLDSAGVRVLDDLVGRYEDRGLRVRLVVPETGPVRLVLRLCAFRDDLLQTDLAAAVRDLAG